LGLFFTPGYHTGAMACCNLKWWMSDTEYGLNLVIFVFIKIDVAFFARVMCFQLDMAASK